MKCWLESSIWTIILGPMLRDVGGFIWRGLITGDDLGDFNAFRHRELFCQKTEDLTDSPQHADTIGFSYDDVLELGRAVIGAQFRVADALGPTVLADASAGEPPSRAIFCARDVVQNLRSTMQHTANSPPVPSSTAVSVATFLPNPVDTPTDLTCTYHFD